MAPITASAPKMTGASVELREPSLPVKLLTAGTAACVADLITFPLDTAKVRLQVNKILDFTICTDAVMSKQSCFYDFVYSESRARACLDSMRYFVKLECDVNNRTVSMRRRLVLKSEYVRTCCHARKAGPTCRKGDTISLRNILPFTGLNTT